MIAYGLTWIRVVTPVRQVGHHPHANGRSDRVRNERGGTPTGTDSTEHSTAMRGLDELYLSILEAALRYDGPMPVSLVGAWLQIWLFSTNRGHNGCWMSSRAFRTRSRDLYRPSSLSSATQGSRTSRCAQYTRPWLNVSSVQSAARTRGVLLTRAVSTLTLPR
ncbi:hypothetical protein BD310DRAFT_198896, partial [Dichomitus squalens]